MDKDLAESKRFNDALDTAISGVKAQGIDRIHTFYESPVFRFINLLGAIQLIDAHDANWRS